MNQTHEENTGCSRQGKTVVSADHELICLVHEEALNRGLEVDSGSDPDSSGYYAEIFDCSLDELAAIMGAAEAQRANPQGVLPLEPTRHARAAHAQAAARAA